MSLYSGGIRSWECDLDMWKLSLALAKKHYNKVHLICDTDGASFLKDLPFDSFIVELDNMPNFPLVWAMGKIYAYRIACNYNKPFLHIDSDVFLWEPLPDSLISSNLIAQSKDSPFNCFVYDYSYFKTKLPDLWIESKSYARDVVVYNMGIFGGHDVPNIRNYSNLAISMIEDPQLKCTWETPVYNDRGVQSELAKNCLLEQGTFAIYLHKNNLTVNTLFHDLHDGANLTYLKYTHLMGDKRVPEVRGRIKRRIAQTPYHLDVRHVTPEVWSNWGYKY